MTLDTHAAKRRASPRNAPPLLQPSRSIIDADIAPNLEVLAATEGDAYPQQDMEESLAPRAAWLCLYAEFSTQTASDYCPSARANYDPPRVSIPAVQVCR